MDLKVFQFYTKFLLFLGITVFLSITTSVVSGQSDFDLIEIKLIDNLDDKRGFCIDIKGYKSRAKIERGLQAHTCYSYQGEIAIDQGLDADRLKQKELFFVHQWLGMAIYKKNLRKMTYPNLMIHMGLQN